MAVIRHASKPGSRVASSWPTQLLARKPRKLAAVALANKTARIVWAMSLGDDGARRGLPGQTARRRDGLIKRADAGAGGQ